MPNPRSRTNRARPERGAHPPRVSQHDPTHSPREVVDEHGMPFVVGNSSTPWCPSTSTAFKLLLTVRLTGAIWSIITDCDETFNYWEPLHFLIYGKGFQTWEYSPEYALRSYLYILVHLLPVWLYRMILEPLPMYVFFFLRCLLAVVCSSAEVYFMNGIRQEVGANVARISLVFLLFSSGMFISGTALLPSTTSLYLTLLSYGAWFRRQYELAILFTALSAFLSWPFSAVIGIPIAIDILLRRRYKFFVQWCIIAASIILLPQIAIDSQYYGKLVIAPLNIVKYNIFTSHGPDLYGTEDWKFYFMNGFLNFNIAFFVALAAYPCKILCQTMLPVVKQSRHDIPQWLMLLGLYLWLAIFFTQSHKEERFLFPIYPLIGFYAAFVIDSLQKLFFCLFIKLKNRHYLDHTNWISVATLILFSLASVSRIFAVYQNYNAPMSAWMHLAHIPLSEDFPSNRKINVCIGKEWHRFPSSFFLPNNNWELKFLKSEFRGQLPQPYLTSEEATSAVRDSFNDLNKEEFNRYDVKLEECDFLVDLDTGRETQHEPRYSTDTKRWKVEESFPFLNAEESHQIFRAFYIPFFSSNYCKYSQYLILRNKERVDKKLNSGRFGSS